MLYYIQIMIKQILELSADIWIFFFIKDIHSFPQEEIQASKDRVAAIYDPHYMQ